MVTRIVTGSLHTGKEAEVEKWIDELRMPGEFLPHRCGLWAVPVVPVVPCKASSPLSCERRLPTDIPAPRLV
jgi:hypothetical protein